MTQDQDSYDPDTGDYEGLSAAEATDEDELDADPLERGADAPDHWSAAERYGNTPYEEEHGETLDQRLAEEEPDVRLDDVPPRPFADTPDDELDSGIDEVVVPDEPATGEGTVVAGEDIERFRDPGEHRGGPAGHNDLVAPADDERLRVTRPE
jgi:hypothetical protein